MKLVTNIAITINDGQVGTRDTVVTGEIQYWKNRPKSIGGGIRIGYSYKDSDGNLLPVKENPYPLASEDVQALFDSLDLTDAPAEGTDREGREERIVYEAFKILMAQTYSIDVALIDIVTE